MSRLASLARRLGHRRWFLFIGRAFVPFDRFLARRTDGRVVLLNLRELPSLLLTTTGRRSGQPRTAPLLYLEDGEDIIVVGSNWGQRHHPAWTVNLLADPVATVNIRGRTRTVRARLATGAERDKLWAKLRTLWPAYDSYAERAGREIRVFVLQPVPLNPDSVPSHGGE